MASWETEITELLQEAQDIAVRFDVEQELTSAQQSTARNNLGISSTATSVSGDDYKITFN